MLLIVGLGNPGKEYENTRHNVGFMAIEEILGRYNFSAEQNKFHGIINQGEVAGVKVLALRPQTYMNRSGVSVSEAASFYKISPENILVFYDELDLIPGKLRIKKAGGDNGHNGIKSIDSHIGKDYWRVRIGIGHPGNKDEVTSYVLGKFTNEDKVVISKAVDAVAEAFSLLAEGQGEKFMSKVALLMQPEKVKQENKKIEKDKEKDNKNNEDDNKMESK